MLNRVLTSVFGSRNERLLKKLDGIVAKVNALEPKLQAPSDDELKAKTPEFRAHPATASRWTSCCPKPSRSAARPASACSACATTTMQLIGGMVLHMGKIAEMRTGEGKTLVATLPVYLNALEGKGVHVVTVNDYLARATPRGWASSTAGWACRWAWSTRACRIRTSTPPTPPTSPTAPTTNSASTTCATTWRCRRRTSVQRGLNYAIVDEVDSILIDEARTPLIISGPADESPELYIKVNRIVPSLLRQKEEGARATTGSTRSRSRCTCPRPGRNTPRNCCKAGILEGRGQPVRAAQHPRRPPPQRRPARARIYQRDVDYIVRDGEVVIVDEFTGRTLVGRRWSDGLHPAVEAKEGVPVQRENQTLASITFQNLFRMYAKLSGMTGTADTEAYEFQSIYGLEVVVIPTHRPMVRKRPFRPGVPQPQRQVPRGAERDQGRARAQAAGAGRHHLDRGVGNAQRAAARPASTTRCSTPSSTSARRTSSPRPAARARSPSPPTWPAAAPISCSAVRSKPSWPNSSAGRGRRTHPRARSSPNGSAMRRGQGRRRLASSAPNATNRAASTTSCAAVPAARATRFLALLPVAGRQPDAHLRRRLGAAGDGAHGPEGRRHHRDRRWSPNRSPTRSAGRGPQLRHPQEPARLRRRQQRPAQGHLQTARRTAGGRQRQGQHRRHPRRRGRGDGGTLRAGEFDRRAVGPPGLEAALASDFNLQLPLRGENFGGGEERDRRRGDLADGAGTRWRSCSPTRSSGSAATPCACSRST